MSYKQFSNLVEKGNDMYKALVKKNGELDPFRKTLIIIDEAHKLYGGADLSVLERPNMDEFERVVQNSYIVSGADSVKLLLMTATPMTDNPLELVRLLNLFKEEKMPYRFDEFSAKYLNEVGKFTAEGKRVFWNEIAGHISYLNRERDARQFAQPVIQRVSVPIGDAFSQIMEKECGMKTKMDNLTKYILLHPNIVDLEKKMEDYERLKETVEKDSLNKVLALKNRILSLQKEVKRKDVPKTEKRKLRLDIKDVKKEIGENTPAKIRKMIRKLVKTKKGLLRTKERNIRTLRKKMKTYFKNEAKMKKQREARIIREQKKEQTRLKTMKKRQEIEERKREREQVRTMKKKEKETLKKKETRRRKNVDSKT